MGHPSLAFAAAAANDSWVAPGTVPWTVLVAAVTVQPASSLSPLTSTWTDRALGGVPALASSLEQAIEKHEAWAAARSSSGEVTPAGSPVRDAQVVGWSRKMPVVAAVTVPFPESRSPLHVAVARRVVAIGRSSLSLGSACVGCRAAIGPVVRSVGTRRSAR